MEIHVQHENPNGSWVNGIGPVQESMFLPWIDAFPTSFQQVRAVLLSRISRGQALKLDDGLVVIKVCEDVMGLFLKRYPGSAIRA